MENPETPEKPAPNESNDSGGEKKGSSTPTPSTNQELSTLQSEVKKDK